MERHALRQTQETSLVADNDEQNQTNAASWLQDAKPMTAALLLPRVLSTAAPS